MSSQYTTIETHKRIFGIGLSKTCTTSLALAMKTLGYKCKHNPKHPRDIEKAQFCNDILIAKTFEFLDKKYPGSKFIYTIRDRNNWLNSCERHFTQGMTAVDALAYQAICFDKEHWLKIYDCHNKKILEYFTNRQDDLLILDIEKEGNNSWDKIMSFLKIKAHLELPNFPYVNVTNEIETFRKTILSNKF